jgi:hypothetical protein
MIAIIRCIRRIRCFLFADISIIFGIIVCIHELLFVKSRSTNTKCLVLPTHLTITPLRRVIASCRVQEIVPQMIVLPKPHSCWLRGDLVGKSEVTYSPSSPYFYLAATLEVSTSWKNDWHFHEVELEQLRCLSLVGWQLLSVFGKKCCMNMLYYVGEQRATWNATSLLLAILHWPHWYTLINKQLHSTKLRHKTIVNFLMWS